MQKWYLVFIDKDGSDGVRNDEQATSAGISDWIDSNWKFLF
jgi:hypothetical protein